MIETINDQLKDLSQMAHARHRSLIPFGGQSARGADRLLPAAQAAFPQRIAQGVGLLAGSYLLPYSGYPDGLIWFAATKGAVDQIVTRNSRDFVRIFPASRDKIVEPSNVAGAEERHHQVTEDHVTLVLGQPVQGLSAILSQDYLVPFLFQDHAEQFHNARFTLYDQPSLQEWCLVEV